MVMKQYINVVSHNIIIIIRFPGPGSLGPVFIPTLQINSTRAIAD